MCTHSQCVVINLAMLFLKRSPGNLETMGELIISIFREIMADTNGHLPSNCVSAPTNSTIFRLAKAINERGEPTTSKDDLNSVLNADKNTLSNLCVEMLRS